MPLESPTAMYADENPYVQSLRVDDNQKALRQLSKGADAIAHGEPVDEVPNQVFNQSVEQIDQQDVDLMEEERQKVRVGTLESVAGSERKDLIPQTIAELQEDYEASAIRAASAVAPQLARNYNTPGAEFLTEDELLKLSIDDYTLEGMAKVLDEQGGFEFAGDLLNMMVIPDQAYNASKLTDANWFTSQDGMMALADHRAALPPDQRIMFDKQFMERVEGVESSEIQKYLTMIDVMGKNPQMAVEHWTEKIFLVGDIAALGTGIIKSLNKVNKMRQLSRLGDNYTAAMAAEISVQDGIGSTTGIRKTDAAMSGNPLKEGLKDDILGGVTTTGSSETRTRLVGVDRALDEIDNVQGVQILPSDRELNDMVAKWTKHYNEMENVESATVTKTVDGVAVEYTTPEGNFDRYVEYRVDDFGGFAEKELGLTKTLTRHVWSPAFLQGADVPDLVNAAVIGSFKKAKVVSQYDKAFKAAVKGIKGNRKSIAKVNDLLNKLNGKDVDINYHNLVNSGIGGTKLTEKEAVSMLEIRRIFDHMHEVNNNTMRREMELRGLRGVQIGGENQYVKAYDTAQDAAQAYRLDVDNNQVAVVGEDGIGSISSLTTERLDEYYNQGYKLVRSDSSDQYGWFKDADSNHSRYALVPRDSVGDLPAQVLPYTPNYIPRLREEANYFIKQRVPMKVNGNTVKRERTVAWAKTETQAARWLERLENSSTDFNKDDWVVNFDRETGKGNAGSEAAVRMNGGLYRGSRSQSGLVYAGTNTEGEVVDALDTLQGAMRYTADRMTMSEMRQTLRHRWYQDAGNIDDGILKLSWQEARGAVADSAASPQVKSKLLSAHDQVSNISSIPVKSEQALQGAIRAIGKHFDKKGKKSAAEFFYKRSGASPIDSLKGGAFHMMLGAFNPAQYLVQFMGATVAVGANPVSFTKAVPRILAASLTDTIDDSITHGKALDLLARKKIGVTKDMEQDILFWKQSGMFESVLRNNADFNNAGKFLPSDAGMLRRGFASLANKSTIFYEMGELGSMRTSFFTALEELKSRAGTSWKYSEESLQQVVARAEQYRLGMSSANKAEFQKGILALPTQFKSIYTKSLEAMFGKQFTPIEKARIGLSQMALFGATGVPFINYFQDTMAEAFLPEGASPEEQLAFKTGVVGWLVSGVWDIDAEIAGRVAIAGDIIQEMEDMMFSEEPFIKSFLGASFTTTDKAVSAFKNTLAAGKLVWEDEQLDSPEKMGLMAKQLGYHLAQLPTSTRRLMEAYVLQAFKEVRTSSGRTLYKKMEEDVQTRDVIARGLGFSSLEMGDIYETNQALYKRKDKIRDLADMYVGMLNTMTIGIDEFDEETVESTHLLMSMIKNSIDNDVDREDIIRAFGAAIKDRQFKDRTVDQWLEAQVSDMLSAKGNVLPTGEERFREVTE